MKFIIEMTGPIVDPRPRYWSAYALVSEQMSLPRVDSNTFWRLVRSGAPLGRWVRGAKPAQVREFQARFEEALELDEHFGLQIPQEDAVAALSRLRGHGECVLITTGSNRMARQLLLDRLDLSVHFSAMRGLPDDQSGRGRVLKELTDGDDRVVVAAGSESVARSALGAGLVACGITDGASASIRLSRAGASPIFANLGELADDVQRGANQLIQAGLLPPRHPVINNPFVTPDHAFSPRTRGGGGYRGGRRR